MRMDAIVVIAASAGGLEPLLHIINALPAPCSASVFIVMHIGRRQSMLPSLLQRDGKLPAEFAEDEHAIEPGRIYVAPPDCHMLVERDRIRLDGGPKVRHTRPAADPLFVSAAAAYGKRVIGVVLSGADSDGADGLRAIKAQGGMAFVQRPDEATIPSMPLAAIAADHPDGSLSAPEIAQRVRAICS
jgi:two-component system, chemotaxis family, protein-glutamate methylesterase/glutaminase